MKRALWLCVLLPVLALPAAAAPFGEAFPLTNTRYRRALGEPRLMTNDRDFFLFWGAERKIRAARVDDGEARVSHVVLDTNEAFDVAWTGDHYVIVGTRSDHSSNVSHPALVGRILDAEAHPVGPEFSVVLPDADNPRIAAGTHSIAVVYTVRYQETRVVILSKNGRVESPSRAIAPYYGNYAVTRRGDGFLAIMSTIEGIRAVALDRHGKTIADRTFAAPLADRRVAVASDGTSSLAMWCNNNEVVALPIDERATFGAPLQLFGSPGSHTTPAVIWNGAGWTAAYTQDHYSPTPKVVIVQLDRRALTILSREESIGTVTPTVAALDGRALAAWRPSGQSRAPVVAALPLAASQPRETPWAPSTQTLLGSASSSNATLTVWGEPRDGGFSIHAGVRNLQGQWSEQQLIPLAARISEVVAASDGDGFAVTFSSELILLDGTGRVTAKVPLPLYPRVMAWNGTNYGLIEQDGLGVLVSPSGVVSALVDLDMDFDAKALTSDGNGFFLAGDMDFCFFPSCGPIPLQGIRLGPDLRRVDAEDYVLRDREGVTLIGVAWDGSRYVAIAHDYYSGSSFIAYMPPLPGMVIETKTIEPGTRPEAMAMLRDGTVAIAGRNNTTSHVAFLKVDGTVLQTSEIEGLATAAPRLEPFAGGGAAFIASTMQNAAPHEGANRIVTAIAHSSGVLPPGPPHIGVRVQNGMMRVDWTASAGTVNGYRLEYRVDDDEWVEWEQWFGPGEQSKSIRKPSFGTQFAFRVRAFNDGGAGEYSAVALTSPGRRRAVR